MRTYVHESLFKYRKFFALLWFADSIAEAEDLGKQGYHWFEKLAIALREDERRLKSENNLNAAEIILEGTEFLERKNYLKVHKTYQEAALQQYRRAEQILKQYSAN